MKESYNSRQRKIYSDYSEVSTENLIEAIVSKKYVDEVLDILQDIIYERNNNMAVGKIEDEGKTVEQSETEPPDFEVEEDSNVETEKLALFVEKDNEPTSNSEESEIVRENKKNKDWFIILTNSTNGKFAFDRNNFIEELKKGLINGTYGLENNFECHYKDEKGNWALENTTVKEFSKDINELKMLYNPVWNHAVIGLTWGAIIGVGLKILDSAILLGYSDPTLSFLFLGAVGITFIRKIGVMGVVIAGFLLTKYTGMNFFMMAIVAAAVGAVLGCLPGMFVGGLIGWIRRNFIPKAHDAICEPASKLILTIGLPLLGGTALIYSYIVYFNPWLISILE
jgi:hypothetical protein